ERFFREVGLTRRSLAAQWTLVHILLWSRGVIVALTCRSGFGIRSEPRLNGRLPRSNSMTEVTYLPAVECIISNANGILDTEIVGVPDESGAQQFLRVAKGFVIRENGKTFLPVGIVELDRRKR